MKKTAAFLLCLMILHAIFGVSPAAALEAKEIRDIVGNAFLEHIRKEDGLKIQEFDAGSAVEGWLYNLPVYAEYSVSEEGKVDLFILLSEAYSSYSQEEANRQFVRARESILGKMTPVGEIMFSLAGKDQVVFEWKYPGSQYGEDWIGQSVNWFFSAVNRMAENLSGSRSVFRFVKSKNTICGTAAEKAETGPETRPDTTGQGTAPSTGKGEWRWVDVEVDCPSCVNGECSVCHGNGYTSMYGVRVDCDPLCKSCGGKGTFTQRQYHFFPEGSDSWLY